MSANISIENTLEIGLKEYISGNYQNSLQIYESIENDIANNDYKNLVKAMNMQGHNHLKLGDIDNSLRLFKRALNLASLSNEGKLIPSLYSYIANCYRILTDNEKCEQNLKKGIKMAEKNRDYEAKAKLYTTLAVMYEGQNELDTAKKYFDEALQNAERSNQSHLIAKVISLMGSWYIRKNDLRQAKDSFEKVLNINGISKERELYCNLKLALIHFKENNINKAHQKLDSILNRNVKIENNRILIQSHVILSAIYRARNFIGKSYKQLQFAKKIARKSIDSGDIVYVQIQEIALKALERKIEFFKMIKDNDVKNSFFSAEYLFAFGNLTNQLLLEGDNDLDFGSLLNQYSKSIELLLEKSLLKGMKSFIQNLDRIPRDEFTNAYKNLKYDDRRPSISDWCEIIGNMHEQDVCISIKKLNQKLLSINKYDYAKIKIFLERIQTNFQKDRHDGTHNRVFSINECLKSITNAYPEIKNLIDYIYNGV